MFIPISAPTTAIYDALTQEVMPKDCTCWTLTPEFTGLLDDKTTFSDLCKKVSTGQCMCQIAADEQSYGTFGIEAARDMSMRAMISNVFAVHVAN